MRVGVEVGGTFTDLVMIEDGKLRVAKVPSTPKSPDIGALDAIAAADIDIAAIADLVHGSTVATNAVLERKGAKVCFFVTKGTRDLMLLQRHDKTAIYDLHYRKPEPVAARRDTFEIDERMAADGDVVRALDTAAARRVVEAALAGVAYDAVAICFLNGYLNPAHEEALADIVRALDSQISITCSHEVTREFREYERASTTTLAAYVQPVIEGYLSRFVRSLEANGFHGRFSVMQSNGGRMPAEAMARNAIAALFSGPAAGVIGALRQVAPSGTQDLITLDMGGTSTDVSLISDGVPDLAPMTRIDGLPVKTPVIDIATVGAGGGSIAWIDDGGLLRVGPQSAGADPGPACYGRGGTLPTVTDAHMIRGSVRADSFLGGQMKVDADASHAVFAPLAAELEMTVEELADSVIRLAEANIVRAIQQVSTERGRDPRGYAIVPFGGAGPLHAARVAEELGVSTVIVPPHAGVLSAAGLLMSDYIHYRARTRKLRLDEAAMDEVRAILGGLEAEVSDYLTALGIEGVAAFDRALEMRYVGQAFEVTVPLTEADARGIDAERLSALFSAEHHRIFEFSKPPDDPVEIVSFRVGVKLAPPDIPNLGDGFRAASEAGVDIEMLDQGKRLTCCVLPRRALPETAIQGPLLIEDGTSTIYAPPGWTARTDARANIVMQVAG
ncbi:MAG: hydantoinase/oxoprolinase family protein [Rickettsiales bacterium]